MGRRASVGGAQKSVAIKFMSARVAGDERHRRMFLAEARLSMLMTHSNVVQVFDAGEEGGRLYLVMEWIDGLDLARLSELRRREGRPWPPRLVAYVIGEVLQGLAYAHHLRHEGETQCVVHRDVSPHNVLVSASGEVKLADFGVARLASEETSGLHIKGKLRYMAPEHLAGRSREPTVDLYGVGAVLHELLTGSRFRDEADEVDLYGQILGGYVPPLEVPGVPLELASLREGLLQPDPRQRIPTATRALEYLAAWAGYRNAAVELGALCRAAMGVLVPRSGIESGPTAPSVDVHADTRAANVPTRTSGRVGSSGPVPSTRTSGAMEAATRTSGSVPLASTAPTRAARTTPLGRPVGRRAVLVAAGVVGAGFVAGGIGVAVLRRREGEGEQPSVEPDAERDELLEPGVVAGAREGSSGVGAGEGTAASVGSGPGAASGGTDGAASTRGAPALGQGTGDGTSARGATTTVTGEPDEQAPDEGSARSPSKPGSPQRVAVAIGLRSPLRVAYVRIGRRGRSVTVAPKASTELAAGRHSIWWRRTPDEPWIDGGELTFTAGRRHLLRLTTTGPVLE